MKKPSRRAPAQTKAKVGDWADVKPVDRYTRLIIAVAIAPAYVAEYFKGTVALDHADLAQSLVSCADAIARRLEKE